MRLLPMQISATVNLAEQQKAPKLIAESTWNYEAHGITLVVVRKSCTSRVAGPTRRTPRPVDSVNGKALFPERCLGQGRKTTILSFPRGGQSPRGACHFDVLVRSGALGCDTSSRRIWSRKHYKRRRPPSFPPQPPPLPRRCRAPLPSPRKNHQLRSRRRPHLSSPNGPPPFRLSTAAEPPP
uniref:Uncharacterized protein n=1 Tax=Musa acuminata TaxID=4641 RepID=Q1ENZ1_MUSAC|nr:hypothetical protein MA4_112I10.58 [Musa acuminata]